MKNILMAGAALLCLAGTSQAQMRMTGAPSNYYYAFGEYDHYSASGGTMNGGGLGLGWRMNRFLAVQAGGQYAQDSGVDFYNGYAEALGHIPFGNRMSAFVSIGGAYGQASTTVPTLGTFTASGSGYRAGAGLEYWLTDRWGLHAAFHRQNVLGVADDYGLGLSFRF